MCVCVHVRMTKHPYTNQFAVAGESLLSIQPQKSHFANFAMSLIELRGLKTVPDIVQEYSPTIKDTAVPLVIENGSYECRVGWSCYDAPLMRFRNLIAKPRREKQKKAADADAPTVQPIQIGNDIVNIEAMRYQLRTQFDRNVVTHYQNQEQIFDYIFKQLAIDTEGSVNHPIVLTECVANPNYSRQLMSELLFECYDVPSVSYGIDSLFSFSHNNFGANGLIVSMGYYTVHVIPVLNNVAQTQRMRRINLGAFNMTLFLHRLLQLKYPVHAGAILLSRIEWLLHTHCSVAYDYLDELRKWSTLEFYEKNVKKIQLPYNVATNTTTAGQLSVEQKTEKRREMAKRLADINARKRDERLAEDKKQLARLMHIKQFADRGDTKEFQRKMRQNMIANKVELNKSIQAASTRIARIKMKIEQSESSSSQAYPFEEKMVQAPRPPANMPIADWIIDVRQKRAALIERRNLRKQRKQDLAKRRTVAAQERMRIISQLARKEKGDDDFGMRDEDWDVYKTISKDGDSDSDTENEKLIGFEEILRHHDPTYEGPAQIVSECTAESYQLHLGVESIRAPELLFQPSMVGSSEAGIIETIEYVLKQFTPDEQLLLAANVFVTGSAAQLPGLKVRIERELMAIRPFHTPFQVNVARQSALDAWNGAKDFANSSTFQQCVTTKHDYAEYGSEYFREHFASNRYYPTPSTAVSTNTSIDTNVQPQQSLLLVDVKAANTTKMEEEIFVDDD